MEQEPGLGEVGLLYQKPLLFRLASIDLHEIVGRHAPSAALAPQTPRRQVLTLRPQAHVEDAPRHRQLLASKLARFIGIEQQGLSFFVLGLGDFHRQRDLHHFFGLWTRVAEEPTSRYASAALLYEEVDPDWSKAIAAAPAQPASRCVPRIQITSLRLAGATGIRPRLRQTAARAVVLARCATCRRNRDSNPAVARRAPRGGRKRRARRRF